MDGWIRDLVRGGSNKRPFTLPNCSCRALKSHALSVSLTYFLVISRSHEYFSRISALPEGNSTVLAIRSAYNRKIPSFTVTELSGFNKIVRLRRFENCKIQKFSGRACLRTP